MRHAITYLSERATKNLSLLYVTLISLGLFVPSVVIAQTQPDWSGANVVIRGFTGNTPEAGYALHTIKDGAILHTEWLGRVCYFGKSTDRLITLSSVDRTNSKLQVFELPQGKLLASYSLPDLFCPFLIQGSDELAIVDNQDGYFTAYVGDSTSKAVLVKMDLSNGKFISEPFPVTQFNSSRLLRAGGFITVDTQLTVQVFSIADAHFAQSIPRIGREYSIFIPHDGLYSWNIQGAFTRTADESLKSLPATSQQVYEITRGVLAVECLNTAQTEKTIAVLSGPRRSGEMAGEPVEPALRFVKPAERAVLSTIKLPFTPTRHIYSTAQKDVIAIVNSVDHTIVKFNCRTYQEVGRIVLPLVNDQPRPDFDEIHVVY